MKILELKLYTNQIEQVKEFYQTNFECKIISDSVDQFSVKMGWSILTFIKSNKPHYYHYAFLVSKSQFDLAYKWALQHLDILEAEENEHIATFENWNAKSFYFYDGTRNLAEVIAHDEIDDDNETNFSPNSILGISEIGFPTTNIESINNKIEALTGSVFWKGDFVRFGTNGSVEGKILLPNYQLKETWFPTSMKIKPEPLLIRIENKSTTFDLNFNQEKIESNNYQ